MLNGGLRCPLRDRGYRLLQRWYIALAEAWWGGLAWLWVPWAMPHRAMNALCTGEAVLPHCSHALRARCIEGRL